MKTKQEKAGTYWERRSNLMYYRYITEIMTKLKTPNAAILDVGSNGCPTLEEFDWADTRVSLDIEKPYNSANVKGIQCDFLAWKPEQHFNIALCLQVLEHVPHPDLFLEKLLAVADTVVVSVPFRWPKKSNPEHIHDPIDLKKLRGWTTQRPALELVVTEILKSKKARRLIACYGKTWLKSS